MALLRTSQKAAYGRATVGQMLTWVQSTSTDIEDMGEVHPERGSSDSTAGQLVLVVDDQAAYRALERRILERGGYRVIEASGGLDACRLLEDPGVPDLLIADLDMPDLPGEEMVRRIHTMRPDLKVLYVTANIDRLLDVQSIAWDGEAFLDKPFTPTGLLEAVSLLLNGTLSGPSK